MDINADFSRRVVMHGDELPWQDSPMKGVSRRMLDRLGDEVARATSIVRYDPGSHFSPHVHTGGEEFVVLEGTFQDEHGDFPPGSYIRNPPQSSHTPGSAEGCVIFVKLWQFDLADRTHVRINMNELNSVPDATRPGIAVTPLFNDQHETVRLEHWQTGAAAAFPVPGGAELLVLEGELEEGDDLLGRHSWLRLPAGGMVNARAGTHGAKVWVKEGHLRSVARPGTT